MDFTNLKACMDKFVREYNTPGVDCLVYKEHEIVFRYFTGMSDIENNKKMDGNELYLIFSMTKMLTCTAVIQLFEQGKYLMSDPISKYLPEFEEMRVPSGDGGTKRAENKIKVIDLFTMSAGLDYELKDAAITNALKEGKKCTREIVGAMSQKTLWFEPGTRFNYSLCHDVIGALIEVWSGQKLGEYMKENIFEPLGMKNTFFGVPKDKALLSRTAVRYTYDDDKKPQVLPLECVYNISEEYESGGAGLTSCTEDYALFLDALSCNGMGESGKRILSPAGVELMKTNHLKGQQLEDFNVLRPGYGYGLGVRTHMDKMQSGSLSPVGEFGWDGAAGAFSLVDTENKISLTYFQYIHNWDLKIQAEIRNALYQSLE